MKIRTRLSILFTLITATILLAFAFVIYYSAGESREKEFYTALKKEALTKANLFFNAKVEAHTLQEIYRSNRQILNEVEVAVYDSSFKLLYHDAVDIDLVKETPQMLNEIYRKGEMHFYQDKWQVIGLRYEYEGSIFIITATALDEYGYNKLESLLRTIVIVFIISILFIYAVGRYFSKKAFDPVTEMINEAKRITASHLDRRLTTKGSKDELSELANTFNDMLDRLESSFDAQKHFVSNISHEIRTPLAAVIAELEISLNKNRSIEEYKAAIKNALSDTKRLVRLSNNLLDLAKASYDPSEISFKQVRVDEVLLDARQQVQKFNPGYKIDISFGSGSENGYDLCIDGNEYLLRAAFINLFENGCKFSLDHKSTVFISFEKEKIKLDFSDCGIGISNDDLRNIFTTFYRGDNKKFAEGNGIGLSLTEKIIHLHQGEISVISLPGRGTTFTVFL